MKNKSFNDTEIPPTVAAKATMNREGEVVLYDVPVVRKGWKTKKYDGKVGIIQRIQTASTKNEIADILKDIGDFKTISEKTKRKVDRIARLRLESLKK